MKLTELVGVKNVTDKMVMRGGAAASLRNHGFEQIGAPGEYGTVWYNPKFNYVLKLFEEEDVGYLKYIHAVAKHQSNPHLPKIIGKPVKISSGVYAVRLAKLTPWKMNRNNPDDIALDWLLSYIDVANWREELETRGMEKTKEAVINFLEKWPKFLDALELINSLNAQNSDVGLDLHDDNVMLDGKCPVIIDPFAPG